MIQTGDSMDDFESIWNALQTHLNPGEKIKIWNPYNGYMGEHLTIMTTDPQFIAIDPPRVWDTRVIPKDDFELVWGVWGDYNGLEIERRTIRDLSDHHKYIISILHWYEIEA
jgi:hypothetical protein